MIKLRKNDGEILVEGNLDLGYMGIYTKENIEFEDDVLEGIAEGGIDLSSLEDMVNGYEKNIKEHIENMNNSFLLQVMQEILNLDFEYWEVDGLGDMPGRKEWEKFRSQIEKWFFKYVDRANDGSEGEKPNVEKFIRDTLPSFNLDGFISHIKPDCVAIAEDYISVQVSDSFDDIELLVGAYLEINDDLSLTEWYNG